MASGNRKVTIQLVDDGAGAGARGPQLFKGQNYEAIRTACLESGILFRDPCFSAGPGALGYDKLGPDSEKAKGVEWKRPHVKWGRTGTWSEGGGVGPGFLIPESEGGGLGLGPVSEGGGWA